MRRAISSSWPGSTLRPCPVAQNTPSMSPIDRKWAASSVAALVASSTRLDVMPLGVRPQVTGAGERDVPDQLDRRAQRVDRLLGRLHAGGVEPAPDDVDVGDHEAVQRQDVGQRPAEPLLTVRRRVQPGHRSTRLGHHVGERGVTDVELPQRRACADPRRAVAVQRQPGDQLERLRPLERRRPALPVDDLDGTDAGEPSASTGPPRPAGRLGLVGDQRRGGFAEDVLQFGDIAGRQTDRSEDDT